MSLAEANGQEKTEQPTSKRRREAREEGNVFQSKDVVTVILLFGVFYMIKKMLPFIYRTARDCMLRFFTAIGDYDPLNASPGIYLYMVVAILKCALPMLLISLVLGIIAYGTQTRFNITFKALKPKFSKMNPISGIKRMFGLKKLIDVAKNLIKIALLLALLYNLLKKDLVLVARMIDMQTFAAAGQTLQLVFDLVVRVCIAFAVVAFFDYLYQRWDYENNLKMTKQEVKEEYKQQEGDPQIKNKIRQKMRESSMRRMMQDLPQADVVITNPTHYAVAIKYDPKVADAPLVVAKGEDYLAARIKEVARENRIEIVENKPLARMLYANVDIGQAVPPELYQAVAEVLAFVYQLQGKI